MSDNHQSRRRELGAKIRRARQMAGLSQQQVARLMSMRRPSVSEIEAGSRRVSADELNRLAELFDVTTPWLLGEAPDSLDRDDPRLQLAARELSRMKSDDLDRLLELLAAMRESPNDDKSD